MIRNKFRCLSFTLMVAATSGAHAATVDLTEFMAFGARGGTVDLQTNLATLALPNFNGDLSEAPFVIINSQSLSDVSYFDYNMAGTGAELSLYLSDGSIFSLQNPAGEPVRYQFATPFSGSLNFQFGAGDSSSDSVATITNLTLLTPVAAVPEPENLAMLLAGLGVMGAVARRRPRRRVGM